MLCAVVLIVFVRKYLNLNFCENIVLGRWYAAILILVQNTKIV